MNVSAALRSCIKTKMFEFHGSSAVFSKQAQTGQVQATVATNGREPW